MISELPSRQNEPDSLRRLAAASATYTSAKQVQFGRIALVFLLAVSSPFVFWWNRDLAEVIAIVGAFVVVAEPVGKLWEAHLVSRGAAIQECFDTYTFSLPWNEYLADEAPHPELVNSRAKQFGRPRDRLKDWYTMTSDVERPYDVLLCQRQNLVWDSRLRRNFALYITIALGLWLTLEIGIWAFVIDVSLADFLLVFVIPGLPAVIAGLDLALSNLRTANIRDRLYRNWNALWQRALRAPESVDEMDLRQLQDAIYVCRTRSVQVPDWLQAKRKSRYEDDSRETLEAFKTELKSRSSAGPESGLAPNQGELIS
ncbi:MAG: S-4TM family putative pore-forming effector [Dehalococcoidia bacterium]